MDLVKGVSQVSVVGADIRRRRLELGMSQRILGVRSEIGSSRISDIENGRVSNLTVETLDRIYGALGVQLPWWDLGPLSPVAPLLVA